MSTPPQLDVLQRWMMHVISHPYGVQAGIEGAAAQAEIPMSSVELDQVIPASQHNSSEQRLGVYANAYFARLFECLTAEFPAVRHVVGEEAFNGFALTFLRQFPPASYTLGELGRHFPESLRQTRPTKESNAPPDWADFLIELATLERLYSEVFDGPGEERQGMLSAESLRMIPADRWPEIRFEMSRSLRLLRLNFPVHNYITAVRKGESAIVPPSGETWLVIHRRDYIVRRTAVDRMQFELLQHLQSGASLQQAMEAVTRMDVHGEHFTSAHLQHWFRDWTAAGYFIGIHLNPPAAEMAEVV